jgi:hypothetical protein
MSYDPTVGKWCEEDPSGYIDGPSLDLAFGDNPTTYLDPSGQSRWTFNFHDFDPHENRTTWGQIYQGLAGALENFTPGDGESLSDCQKRALDQLAAAINAAQKYAAIQTMNVMQSYGNLGVVESAANSLQSAIILLATSAVTLPIGALAGSGVAVNLPGVYLLPEIEGGASLFPVGIGVINYGTLGGGLVSGTVSTLTGAAINYGTAIANFIAGAPPGSPFAPGGPGAAELSTITKILNQNIARALAALNAALKACAKQCGK